MANPFSGKSIFAWNVPGVLNGDPNRIAEWLVSHGFNSVMVKAADGPYVFRPSWPAFPAWLWRPNVDRRFVDTLRLWGLLVIGWGFNYGRDGDGEGRVAAQQCDALGLDGWVWDVEGAFENRPTAIQDAGKVVGTFNKNIQRKVPTAFCGWAEFYSPSGSQWHNVKLAKFFMDHCDTFIPMFYADWYDNRGKPVPIPTDKLEKEFTRLYAQWTKITYKPIVPAGGAYIGDGVVPTAETIATFAKMARLLCDGVTWWGMDWAIKMPEIDTALDLTPGWDLPAPGPIDPPVITPPRFTGTIRLDKTPHVNVRAAASAKAARVDKIYPGDPFIGDKSEQQADGLWIHINEPAAGWIRSDMTIFQDHEHA